MADFGVIVGLDVTSSVKEIRDVGIPKLKKELDADTSTRLQLIGQLDSTKTLDIIKAQLNGIAKSGNIPKINLGIDLTSAKNAVNQFAGDIRKSTQSTDFSKTILNAEQLDKEGRIYITKVTDVLERVKNRFLKQGATDVQFLEFRKANDQLRSFIATVDYGAGIIKKFNFEKARIDTGGAKPNNGFVQTDFKSVSDKTMKDYQKTLNFLNTMDKRISDINSKTLNQTKPLQQGTTFYDNYINKLNSVLAIIEKVRTSNNSLTDEEKRNIGLIVNELKNVAKEQQTLAYPPTKLESKSISDSVKKYSAELQTLEQKWKSQGLLVGEFKQKVENLKTSIANVGEDKNALSAFTTQLSIAKQAASKLQSQLRETRSAENLKTKIAVLTNQLIAFKNANSKAMNSTKLSSNGLTFSAEIDSMLAKLKQCADPAVYNQVANNFKIIKNEVTALGLKGADFLGSLWANLKKFASWMGMTTAITNFSMYIRQSINELKEIDTILTEISKTSDRTSESLEKLGKTSFLTASKYGQKASDYLLGVQEMSRAGFGETESEQMAELSTLAQSAGDMTAELANEYLIATNAGYKFGGSAEKLNSVLDSQNYITNHNALTMSELAEATKIVSSQASQAGIGIDQMTAVLGTMIATTQQGGEVAARAFKGILMNLQQVKGTAEDIGDGGEDITTESLTKYEKACADLGVSLKEVKDGVLQLRDPMIVLEELSNAVSEEAEGSIKVANLINAVGGKYRGNQLTALLQNWETYSKMLAEYNSTEASGSAFEEAMKSAESWEGKLNELSNTWTDFINGIVTSDNAKAVISFINSVIKGVDTLSDSLGAIPTLIGAIVGSTMAFKNVGELLNTPVSILPHIISIENVTRFKIRLSNCWDDYAKAL